MFHPHVSPYNHDNHDEYEPRSPLCPRPGPLVPNHGPCAWRRPGGNENHVEDNNVATLRMCISFGGFLLEIRAMEGEEGVAGGF